MLQCVFDDAADMGIVQAVLDPFAIALSNHEPSLAEVAEVMGQCALLDAELIPKGADVGRPLALKPCQHRQTDWVSHTGEQVDGPLESQWRKKHTHLI